MPRRLRVSHYMPEDHGSHADFIAPWARAVEAASGGALSLAVHPGPSEFGKLENQYAQVVSGAVDVAHSPAGLPEGRFPLTMLVNMPFMAASSEEGARLLSALFEPHLAPEYGGLKVLALHADSGGVLHTRDAPVTRLEQLDGLRLRCPAGPMEAALRCFGVEPVPLTPPDIREAAEAGRIDGAVMAWDVLAYTGTADIFRHHTDTKLYVSPLYFVMNRASWLGLDPPARDALEACSGAALARRFPAWWNAWEAPGRALGLGPGHTMAALASDELARWREKAAPAVAAHVDALVASGHAGARPAYEAALALRDRHSPHPSGVLNMAHYPGWDATFRGKVWRTTHFPRIREDMPTFLGVPHAVKTGDLEGADVVIIGAPFVAGFGRQYSGVDKDEWIEATKRVRQQSIRYRSGYIQDFDLDVFEHLKVVDYGDADIPPEASYEGTVEKILEAEAATILKVEAALDVGAVPIVIGQNSPCGSYAVGKPIADRVAGPVGMVSLDTHWDAWPYDWATMSPHVAGSTNWKDKLYRDCPNMRIANLVEIGERGMLEDPATIRRFVGEGACFMPMWKIRTELGIEGCVRNLDQAFAGTDAVYCHFDMDVLGGAGPAEGDILGELAEPIGMTDYEAIRLGHECGRRGAKGLSFICIPPGSAVTYRVIVYVIMYFMAGLAMRKLGKGV